VADFHPVPSGVESRPVHLPAPEGGVLRGGAAALYAAGSGRRRLGRPAAGRAAGPGGDGVSRAPRGRDARRRGAGPRPGPRGRGRAL